MIDDNMIGIILPTTGKQRKPQYIAISNLIFWFVLDSGHA